MKKLAICLLVLSVVGCNSRNRPNPSGKSVTGIAQYEKLEVSNSSLTNTKSLQPIRFARVELIDTTDGNRVVNDGATDGVGHYDIDIPIEYLTTALAVRVVAKCDSFPFSVTDHRDDVWTTTSEVFVGPYFLDILATVSGDRVAGAFNIYSAALQGLEFVRDQGRQGSGYPTLVFHWKPGKDGIGCTCYTERFLQPALINIPDTSDNHTEFDDSVILHELGHYLHNSFSVDDSPGGEHTISCASNQIVDPRLAWSEGWATGFAQIVLGNPYYTDTYVPVGFTLDIEFPCAVHQGGRSEYVISAMYWDLYDGNDRAATQDADTISIPFHRIWSAMKAVGGSDPTVTDFYHALINGGSVTAQEWDANFQTLGLEAASLP